MDWILPKHNKNLIDWLYETREVEDSENFFRPKFESLFDPLELYDMQNAVQAIKDFIKAGKKIVIHGDFDVDGICSTSLLWQFLYREMNADCIPYIPSRFNEGYGLSEESINAIINLGADLIITVDCGVKDLALVNKYSNKVKFIITDHHTMKTSSEKTEDGKVVNDYLISDKALAVVHPKLNNYPFKDLCGTAVTWKLCSALNKVLGLGINMQSYLDLAALGTICDVMPVTGENRTIIKLGLEQLKHTQNVGLRTMINFLKINPDKIDTYHVGFVIGPRLNASGRLDSAMDAVRLLTTNDTKFALTICKKLDDLNSERQQLTRKYLDIAEEQIANQQDSKLFFVYGEDWPEGIVGLIAGKLTEKYNRPVLAGSLKNNRLKGSARSIEEFHIAENLSKLKKILTAYGGHAQAAGFSMDESSIEQFKNEITKLANNSISSTDLNKKLLIDSILTKQDINLETIKKIEEFAPFGIGNSKPLIAILSSKIRNYRYLGEDSRHIKLTLDSDSPIELIGWNSSEKFDEMLSSSHNGLFDFSGYLEIDTWGNQEKPVIKLVDFRASE